VGKEGMRGMLGCLGPAKRLRFGEGASVTAPERR